MRNLFISNNRAKVKLQGKMTNTIYLELDDNIIVCQSLQYIDERGRLWENIYPQMLPLEKKKSTEFEKLEKQTADKP